MQLIQSSAESLSIIQLGSTILALAGLFYFDYTLSALLTVIIAYFLYAGVGVSMMYHRYWTHRSFKMNKTLAWLLTWFGIVAGRGSVIGWVYIHREHHKYADTELDPHRPEGYTSWKVFFPHLMGYGRKLNKFVVRDMLNKTHANISKYYLLYVIGWVSVLAVINPWLAYFGWIVPVAITNFALNTFLFMGHGVGYKTHITQDTSTNDWIHGYLLWGEGWHNNHHAKPGRWNFSDKWWELDPVAWLVRVVKQ